MHGREHRSPTRPRPHRGRTLLAGVASRPASAGLVVAAPAVVLLLDRLQSARDWSTLVVGVLDEPAHLLTTWLALAALAPRAGARLRTWALVGSVVIDLDHVPFFLGWQPIVSPVGRPVTHSLAVVAVLVLLGAAPRLRVAALALAAGVLSHLARDLATGPGVPLLWPLSPDGWTVPHAVYAAGLVLAALVALARVATAGRPGTSRGTRPWARSRPLPPAPPGAASYG